MITKGNQVRVFPHGSPAQATVGTVTIISGNQRSIAVAFEHMPPFAFHNGGPVGIVPELGIMFLAYRHQEVGPWIEMMGGGHFEIEEMHHSQ